MKPAAAIPTWLTQSNLIISAEPSWLGALREQHRQAFLTRGLPNRDDERWKYTDLSLLSKRHFTSPQAHNVDVANIVDRYRLSQDHLLLVLVNGCYQAQFTDGTKIPEGMIVSTIQKAMSHHEELIKSYWPEPINAKHYPFASLNSAMFSDGLFVYLPAGCSLAPAIHVLSFAVGQEFIVHPNHLIIAGDRSQCVLLEEYHALSHHAYMMNIVTQIRMGKEAKLDHYKIQNESQQAIHMAHTFVQQTQGSRYAFSDFSLGSLFARDDVVVKLGEADAECRTSGFYRLNQDNQYVDHHVEIDHIGERTKSEMLYKGILDKKSCAVFNGYLHVNENAQKILAYQANHNLLLSNTAEVYSKPELVIYADDVKCKHGATTGQLDQDALFYLRSRGIDLHQAMHILTKGFAEEVMQRIAHPSIKLRVRETYEK